MSPEKTLRQSTKRQISRENITMFDKTICQSKQMLH